MLSYLTIMFYKASKNSLVPFLAESLSALPDTVSQTRFSESAVTIIISYSDSQSQQTEAFVFESLRSPAVDLVVANLTDAVHITLHLVNQLAVIGLGSLKYFMAVNTLHKLFKDFLYAAWNHSGGLWASF